MTFPLQSCQQPVPREDDCDEDNDSKCFCVALTLVSSIVPRVLTCINLFNLHLPHRYSIIIIPILEMKKLRLREIKSKYMAT